MYTEFEVRARGDSGETTITYRAGVLFQKLWTINCSFDKVLNFGFAREAT